MGDRDSTVRSGGTSRRSTGLKVLWRTRSTPDRAHRTTVYRGTPSRPNGMDVRGEVIVVVEPYHVQVEVIDESESAEVVL